MTGDEEAVIRALKRYQEVTSEARTILAEARLRIMNSCSHPEEYVVEYTWEHDNGYGVQKKIVGLRCELCLREKPWKTMGHWS